MIDTAPGGLIDALSRLNVHARAFGFGKKAIYAYKTFVACAFAEEVRSVQALVKCHHCSGTGIYRDWDGIERGRCRRCTRGTVTLRFIESRIGEVRWHHPTSDRGCEVRDAVWQVAKTEWDGVAEICILADGTRRPVVYDQAEGWGPNMPAERLPADEACRLLNIAEPLISEVRVPSGRQQASRWAQDRAIHEMARYPVVFDRIDEGCCICGAHDGLVNCYGLCSHWGFGFVEFGRPMCAACHGTGPTLRWPMEPAPASLAPNVAAWLAQALRQRQRVVERDYGC
jgi:hypothetical protein